ncbi:TetR family transcriptional regulator [Actinomycetospora endophytica]|uniref:TetR family transcriptional regulator n=1 Tax=Actinomycetospora endophytica TaxID=2291215 RepID=A0ABS8PEG9_9PSEU|nr:TetR family transcriptional regulator [Actinomycetospora endophytica]MCD2195384.1 TetR family transcriptional regulator [Actinomycetospora endophytica]
MSEPTTDGRLLKGQRRRRALIEACVRTIGRVGVPGVSQRVVAAEAGVPPSAVAYYFPTVDELLLATLCEVNDGYVAALERCGEAPDPLDALAEVIAGTGQPGTRASAAAEYELFMLAGRGERWQREYERWAAALTGFFTSCCRLDPARAESASAAVDGLFIRAYCLPGSYGVDQVRAILTSVVGPVAGPSSPGWAAPRS